MGIALALGASLTWGLADFFGPLQGRVLGALRALVYVQLGGLVGIALIVAVRGKGPDDAVAFLAIPAAVSGTLGLFAYYRGIAVGAISIVAPIAGVSAVVPVIVGIVSGDRPSALQLVGIAAALLGVFLASLEPERAESRIADFWWASLFFRITSTSVIVAAVAVQRPALGVARLQLGLLFVIGIGDM